MATAINRYTMETVCLYLNGNQWRFTSPSNYSDACSIFVPEGTVVRKNDKGHLVADLPGIGERTAEQLMAMARHSSGPIRVGWRYP